MRPEPSFIALLQALIDESGVPQYVVAGRLEISASHLSDLLAGRRTPSVRAANLICDYFDGGPVDRLKWHRAAARTKGWEV